MILTIMTINRNIMYSNISGTLPETIYTLSQLATLFVFIIYFLTVHSQNKNKIKKIIIIINDFNNYYNLSRE